MDGHKKIRVISVVGPTASGKTGLAVDICKRIGGEAVSCDSMQIYKGMDIATAKPSKAEMCGIPHHMMDFLEPSETFSVAAYCSMARECIEDIHSRGKTPVIVGGTGLYYSSLIDNISFSAEDDDPTVRQALSRRLEAEGAEALLAELNEIDPQTAKLLHPNNTGRIIRALEVYQKTGVTMSEQKRLSRMAEPLYDCTAIGLDAHDRQVLYNRINSRVDIMINSGLLEEAKAFLTDMADNTAGQAIGYKELRPYFENNMSLDEAIENLKMETRRYAKRQLTWFRRDKRINWLYIDDESQDSLTDRAVNLIEP